MGPPRVEGCEPGLKNLVARRVLNLSGVGAMLLDVHHNRPSTITRMFQVFRHRIILLFPTIEGPPTQKAYCIIGIRLIRVIIEARMRQL